MMSQLGSDVVRLVSVLRQIAVKTCIVFSAALLTSVVAFVVLRRLEPVLPVAIASSSAAAGREDSPGAPCRDDVLAAGVISSAAGSTGDGRATDEAIADRTSSDDVKMAHRMPFSETHV